MYKKNPRILPPQPFHFRTHTLARRRAHDKILRPRPVAGNAKLKPHVTPVPFFINAGPPSCYY